MSVTPDVTELQERVNDQVVNYYNVLQEDYNKYFLTKHHGMHYGYWDDSAKSHEESVAKMDKVCAETVGIEKTDFILDAGCGVGGSSVWLAKNFGARVIGITLVPIQVEMAKRFAVEKGVEHLVNFEIMDFTNTKFDNETFDVVWALESACHAVDKRMFLAESRRILKKGGRLMVSDGFLKKDPDTLSESEMEAMKEWTSGWAVPNLATIDQFRKYLIDLGFENIKFKDISENVLPTAKLINSLGRRFQWIWRWELSWWWIPTAKLIDMLRLKTPKEAAQLDLLSRSKIKLADTRAMIAQLKLFEGDICCHAIFCAKKK